MCIYLYLSIYLSICLSVYLPVDLSIYRSIYLSCVVIAMLLCGNVVRQERVLSACFKGF